jgi:imidazolonepropionase
MNFGFCNAQILSKTMRVILQNIAELVQVEDRVRPWVAGREMSELKTIKNAFLYIREELIEDFGQCKT